MVAHSVKHGEVRKFRLSRIESVEATPLHFTVPEGFSVEEHFEGAWYVFGGSPEQIGLRFSHRVARFVRERRPLPGQQIQTLRDGSVFYRATVRNLDEVAWWLMQYGGEASVVYPRELADKVVALARGVLRANGARAGRPYVEAAGEEEGRVAEPPPAP